jgi:hypothetical protein
MGGSSMSDNGPTKFTPEQVAKWKSQVAEQRRILFGHYSRPQPNQKPDRRKPLEALSD